METGAPVWAGLERGRQTALLFVGNEQGVLHAIDRDGKVRWKFATDKPIRAQPKVIGEHVYVASDSGYLYKLDRKSGAKPGARASTTAASRASPPIEEKTRWDRYGSSVVADAKRLYVASRDKNLYALDIKTGREAWRVAAGDIMTATPALHGDIVIFAAFDGKVQAVSAQGWHAALDLRCEARRCRRCGGGRRSRAGGQPQLRSDRARCGHGQGTLEALLLVLVDRIAAGGA